MRKRKISASEALANLNAAAPKQQMNYGGRETLATFKNEFDRQQEAQKQADLEATLAPIKQEQAKILAELQKKEIRELRIALMLKPSFDFDAPLYEGGEYTAERINAALRIFRENEGRGLSDADLRLLREFLQVNDQKQFDLTNPQTWALAWEFIQSKLSDLSPIETVETVETVETEVNETAQPTEPPRDVYTQTWMADLAPIFREAVDSLERSSGLVMHHPQMLELAAHFDKRSANSKRPIPMSVAELRRTAFQLWGNDIGLQEQDRWFVDFDADLTADEMKRKYGFTHSYSTQMLTATDNARG